MKEYVIISAMNKNTNYIKKALDITKENIILAQPLVIFMIVLSFTLAGLAMQAHKGSYMVFLIANVLLCTAFFAGWFYMVKQGILLNRRVENGEYKDPQDRASASIGLGKEFFPGVGEYFLPMTLTMIIYTAAYVLVLFLGYKAGMHFLPNPHLDVNQIYSMANATPAEIQKYVYSLNLEQLRAINLWMLFMGTIVTVFTFLTMFMFPAVFDKKSEKKELFFFTPFTAFNRNLVFIFKNFLGSIGILLFLFVLNTILSVLGVFFNLNIVLSIVGLIISFYFMTYAIILIFLYYESGKH